MDTYLGREIVKRGFVKYFDRFGLKNTRLDDLVDCLDEAVQEHGKGKEIDFRAWTEDWLKKSGVNTLKLELDDDQKLNIVQGHAKHGDKQLRAQRLDVMIWFDEQDCSSMTLKDIMVEKAEMTFDILSQVSDEQRQEFNEKFSSNVFGLVNANNRGYCKVLLR